MAFRKREEVVSGTHEPSPRASTGGPTPQPCGSLARVLSRIFRGGRPEVLDLGPMCGQSVVYLLERGAKVHVEPFEPPAPTPAKKPGKPAPQPKPLRLDQPDGRFDLVLIWEQADFVPPERLEDFGAEIGRVLKDGGWIFLMSQMKPQSESERPARYRLLADDMLVRETTDLPPRRRWAHATRDIERSLKGFSIHGVHLQRTQMREFSAFKPDKKKKKEEES
ncbi:MAG: class I SAM-dependent methyltransferase [Acidobacteriota bacterium]|nr:class I SAM-dependent methyltransferase [Acidobacteriota bacterium]